MHIQQASKKDLSLIVEWTHCLFEHEDDGQLATSENFSENLTKWLETFLDSDNCIVLIAYDKETPCGFIAASSIINDNGFIKEPVKGFIQLVWVDSQYRSSGVASTLVSEVEVCFKSIGINYVECSYVSGNTLAKNFWHNSGYEVISETVRRFI